MTALRAHAYPPAWRLVAGALAGASGVGLFVVLALVLLSFDPPITPPVLFRLTAVLVVLPAGAAWLVARAHAATLERRADALVVRGRRRRLEIPFTAIAGVTPWRVPLPSPGVTLSTRAGRLLALALPDPSPLLAALADAGVDAARTAAAHPAVIYARARQAVPPPRWYHRIGKFALFGFLPAAVLFYTHQHIAYGALLGEYYLLGPRAWLGTLLEYWAAVVVYLVLFAAVWRALVEAVAMVTARVAPARAAQVRPGLETACRVLYFGGVPAVLVLRYLA